MKPTAAIIRAAGRGERMGEITRYFQKCVLPIDDRPLIIHWIEALRVCSIDCRHVVIGYKGDQVMQSVQAYEAEMLMDGEAFTTSSMIRYDGIWEDTRHQIDMLRYLQERIVLLCYADNYSNRLTAVISQVTALRALLSPLSPMLGIIGLIPNSRCSSQSQRARLGSRVVHEGTEPVFRVTAYETGLKNTNGWAWSGVGLFASECFDRNGADTTEILSLLAQEGRLAALRITELYTDVMQVWKNQRI